MQKPFRAIFFYQVTITRMTLYSWDFEKIGGDLWILIDNRWPTRNRRVM